MEYQGQLCLTVIASSRVILEVFKNTSTILAMTSYFHPQTDG